MKLATMPTSTPMNAALGPLFREPTDIDLAPRPLLTTKLSGPAPPRQR
jgi:hypothetical protein